MQLVDLVQLGIHGVAVAILLLSFWLLRDIVRQKNPDPIKFKAVLGFLMASFFFLVGSGVIDYYSSNRLNKVFLEVTPSQFGTAAAPFVKVRNQPFALNRGGTTIEVGNQDSVLLNMEDIHWRLRRLEILLREESTELEELADNEAPVGF